MTWETHHRRQAALRTATAVADRRMDGLLPWDLDEVRAAFDTPEDLLLALQMRWRTRLTATLERLDADQDARGGSDRGTDLESLVVHAYRSTAADLPGTRRVLDVFDAEPALQRARAHELAWLATEAGRAFPGDPGAARRGLAVRARARGGRRRVGWSLAA